MLGCSYYAFDMDADIKIIDDEFHCPGSFGPMHKQRPNAEDLEGVKAFAQNIANS